MKSKLNGARCSTAQHSKHDEIRRAGGPLLRRQRRLADTSISIEEQTALVIGFGESKVGFIDVGIMNRCDCVRIRGSLDAVFVEFETVRQSQRSIVRSDQRFKSKTMKDITICNIRPRTHQTNFCRSPLKVTASTCPAIQCQWSRVNAS